MKWKHKYQDSGNHLNKEWIINIVPWDLGGQHLQSAAADHLAYAQPEMIKKIQHRMDMVHVESFHR